MTEQLYTSIWLTDETGILFFMDKTGEISCDEVTIFRNVDNLYGLSNSRPT